MAHAQPTLIPLRNTVHAHELEALAPGAAEIIACDFYVAGAEAGAVEPGGLRLGRILNVDHHAPVPWMQSRVTSTALAVAHRTAEAAREATTASHGAARRVVINHIDCDSVCASGILLGRLEPTDEWVAASIAADHTGAADPVADLLQALDRAQRGTRSLAAYEGALDNLARLRAGRPLTSDAVAAVAHRAAHRAAAERRVATGQMVCDRGVACGVFAEDIDGAFFPALLPSAAVIMIARRSPDHPDRWLVKLRLGLAAPAGLTLHNVGIQAWDPVFGGRWNAGSNKRDGGTVMDPVAYGGYLERRLAAWAPAQVPAPGDGATLATRLTGSR